MTEHEWLVRNEPWRMLKHLGVSTVRDDPGPHERKLQLFTVARCRRLWGSFTRKESYKAVEAAELFVEGDISREELSVAVMKAGTIAPERPGPIEPYDEAAHWVAPMIAPYAMSFVVRWLGYNELISLVDQADLLREVFGNPFRKIGCQVCACQGGLIRQLASLAYEGRHPAHGALDPASLAVLSDALEEAGCEEKAILEHLRSSGPHVRGCWALDLILGKE